MAAMVAIPTHWLIPVEAEVVGDRKGRGGVLVWRVESFIHCLPQSDESPVDGGEQGVPIGSELEALSGELNEDRIEPVDLGFNGLLLSFDPTSSSMWAKRPYEKGPQTETDNT